MFLSIISTYIRKYIENSSTAQILLFKYTEQGSQYKYVDLVDSNEVNFD